MMTSNERDLHYNPELNRLWGLDGLIAEQQQDQLGDRFIDFNPPRIVPRVVVQEMQGAPYNLDIESDPLSGQRESITKISWV